MPNGDSESRREKDLLGRPVTKHQDSAGHGIGETRHEVDWPGNRVDIHVDADGKRAGESRFERDLLGREVERRTGPDGERVSETRQDSDLFGRPVRRTYDPDGELLAETRGERDLLGRWVHRTKQVGGDTPPSPGSQPTATPSQASWRGAPFSSRPTYYRRSMGPVLLAVALPVVVVIIGVVWLLGAWSESTDGFRKTVGFAPLFKSTGSLYPIPDRGTQGLARITYGSIGKGAIKLVGGQEQQVYPVRLEVALGPMVVPLEVRAGDNVSIEVSSATRTYKAMGAAGRLESIPVTGWLDEEGRPIPPRGELRDRYGNDYPDLRMGDCGLLVQLGGTGRRFYIGAGGQFTVPRGQEPADLRFFLNAPQREELMDAIPKGQHLKLEISILRPV